MRDGVFHAVNEGRKAQQGTKEGPIGNRKLNNERDVGKEQEGDSNGAPTQYTQ
jgi:hypothetical protein